MQSLISVIQPSAFFSLNIYIITGEPDGTLKNHSTGQPDGTLENNSTDEPDGTLKHNSTSQPGGTLKNHITGQPDGTLENNNTSQPNIISEDYTGVIAGGISGAILLVAVVVVIVLLVQRKILKDRFDISLKVKTGCLCYEQINFTYDPLSYTEVCMRRFSRDARNAVILIS